MGFRLLRNSDTCWVFVPKVNAPVKDDYFIRVREDYVQALKRIIETVEFGAGKNLRASSFLCMLEEKV